MRFLVVLAADSGDAFVPAEGRQVCTRTQSIPHLVQGDSFDQRCVQDITLGDGNVPGEPLGRSKSVIGNGSVASKR